MLRSQFSRLCGLTVVSDQPIPGLSAGPVSADVDLEIHLGGPHPWSPADGGEVVPVRRYFAADDEGPGLEVARAPGGAYFRLAYRDGTCFTIDGAGRAVWASWREPSTLSDVSTYLLGPVLGFTLRRRGVVSLHASAVAAGDAAVALMGPAGIGKSTTATAFARLGFPVLSDDLVPLLERSDAFLAQPTYPRLRLWPDSVERLYGSADALPRFSPTWEKRFLDLAPRGYAFEQQPRPLQAVYALRLGASPATPAAAAPLAGQQALMALVHNSYVNYLLDPEMRAHDFDCLARLVARVPVRALTLPSSRPSPEDVCRLVLRDLAELGVLP